MAEKKFKSMVSILDKLADARAIAVTVELALGGIDRDVVNNDASEVRLVALMMTRRLRKIEKWLNAHHEADRAEAGHD